MKDAPHPLPFDPARTAALARLSAFVPQAGAAYARLRNHDRPAAPTVSGLSPWIRHRIVTEAAVLAPVLAAHGPDGAAKFVDEVFWRAYWKGWLQMRPAVWDRYQAGVQAGLNRIATESGLRRTWEAACEGRSGIAGFDDWAAELAETGWLHNHARMWFASIWVFTLELPWELGADFFLRHLIDGDPASNTLSWRWVAGLHTAGKSYLATADNIAAHTGNRFRPGGLARQARVPADAPVPAPGPLPAGDVVPQDLARRRWGLLLTEEDLSPADLLPRGAEPVAVATLDASADRSPLIVADPVRAFTAAALAQAGAALAPAPLTPLPSPEAAADWARAAGLGLVVAPFAPVGPAAAALARARAALRAAGVHVIVPLRDWDAAAWPHATHGFFRFRAAIPDLLRRAGLPG